MADAIDQNIITAEDTKKKKKQIQAAMFLLQSFLDDTKKEVDSSYARLKVDIYDDFAKKIDKMVKNHPFDNLINISKDVDNKTKDILKEFVISFLNYNKKILNSVYYCSSETNELNFVVCLNDDKTVNRQKMFEFSDQYEGFEISKRYPIYFRFLPIELIHEVNYSEKLKFHS